MSAPPATTNIEPFSDQLMCPGMYRVTMYLDTFHPHQNNTWYVHPGCPHVYSDRGNHQIVGSATTLIPSFPKLGSTFPPTSMSVSLKWSRVLSWTAGSLNTLNTTSSRVLLSVFLPDPVPKRQPLRYHRPPGHCSEGEIAFLPARRPASSWLETQRWPDTLDADIFSGLMCEA